MKAIFKYHLLVVITLAGFLYTAGCNKTEEEAPEQALLEATLDGSPNFKWNSQGRFLTINTTADWTVTFSYPEGAAEWCTVTPAAGAGYKNVWIATTANNTDVVREATVTVTAAAENISIDIFQYTTDEEALPIILENRPELPEIEDTEWLLHYKAGEYTLEYSITEKHSKWVAWQLYSSHMGSASRSRNFTWDPNIPAQYSPVYGRTDDENDFNGTPDYDRGHLCPSADRTQSAAMNQQTFMYSNMSPQIPAFNQGIWGNLETKVRSWVGMDTLYICAGGTILKDSDIQARTTPSHMAVPRYYFKVILRKKAGAGAGADAYDAIGFWFENRSYNSKTEPLSKAHVKTVDDIEKLTGINFFYQLPEDIQDSVEKDFKPGAWGL
jgi:endonuclease G